MTTRKSSEEIEKEILDFLFEGPKSINEIAEKIGSTWPTTNSYLEKLKENGKVNELLATDKMRIYRRTDDPIYFSLPIKKEIRLKTLFLLKEIKKAWEKEGRGELSQTALQKIAVDVIKSKNLDLPVLRFHYGMTTCASPSKNNMELIGEISESPEKKLIFEGIKEAIEDPKHTGKASDEKEYQYKKYNLPFYQARENLIKSLLSLIKDQKDSEQKFSKIEEDLFFLSANFPIAIERFYSDFYEFISKAQLLIYSKSTDPQKIETLKETLNQLWDKLTTYTSFVDSERFIELDKKQLFEQIRELNINFKEMNYKIYLDELKSVTNEIDPFKIEMPLGEISSEIQSIILEGLENE